MLSFLEFLCHYRAAILAIALDFEANTQTYNCSAVSRGLLPSTVSRKSVDNFKKDIFLTSNGRTHKTDSVPCLLFNGHIALTTVQGSAGCSSWGGATNELITLKKIYKRLRQGKGRKK